MEGSYNSTMNANELVGKRVAHAALLAADGCHAPEDGARLVQWLDINFDDGTSLKATTMRRIGEWTDPFLVTLKEKRREPSEAPEPSDTQGCTACEDCKFGLVVRPRLICDDRATRGDCTYDDCGKVVTVTPDKDAAYYYVRCKLNPQPVDKARSDWCGQGRPKEDAHARTERLCVWTEDFQTGDMETQCGHRGPVANRYVFCQYCGGRVQPRTVGGGAGA